MTAVHLGPVEPRTISSVGSSSQPAPVSPASSASRSSPALAGAPALGEMRLADRGQIHSLCGRRVVEADHRQVSRHRQAELPRGAHGAERESVAIGIWTAMILAGDLSRGFAKYWPLVSILVIDAAVNVVVRVARARSRRALRPASSASVRRVERGPQTGQVD